MIVASVSCIYGLGRPRSTRSSSSLRVGEEKPREQLLRGLVDIQYQRNDTLLGRPSSAPAAT